MSLLYALIEHDLPPCPNGLVETWQVIIPILRQRRIDKDYTFVPEIPVKSQVGV